MYDLIRDSTLGQIVRYLSRNKYLLYPDEIPGFEHPAYKPGYNAQQQESKENEEGIIPTADTAGSSQTNVAATSRSSIADEPNRTSTASSADITAVEGDVERDALPQNPVERLVTQQSQHAVEKTQSLVIQPTKTADGVILVDWYTTDDPENPANWSLRKKAFIAVQIW
jgi:DHA1 family multidrug resistance protein-like MFS transporter